MPETTISSAEGWRPNIVSAYSPDDALPDAVILQVATQGGVIEGDAPSLLVPYVDDADAAFVAEGQPINESDPGLAQVAVFTGKVAQLVSVSREQMNQPGASQRILTSVQRAVTRKANAAFISQPAPAAPATTPPAGIMSQAATLDDQVTGNLDPVADAVGVIEEDGGQATHILASPTSWSALRKMKAATDSNTSLLGAGTDDADRRLLGLPVLTTPAVPANTILVVDKAAIVSAVGAVLVAQSDQYLFGSDSLAVRVTWRFGAQVVKPARLVSLTVAPAA